jgi:hypothetical protein
MAPYRDRGADLQQVQHLRGVIAVHALHRAHMQHAQRRVRGQTEPLASRVVGQRGELGGHALQEAHARRVVLDHHVQLCRRSKVMVHPGEER